MTATGIIKEAEDFCYFQVTDPLPNENGLEMAVKNYDKRKYEKYEMLNCVMYRIIERGGVHFGPRRAFLFTKEFKRNIDIPMMYGVDITDPEISSFINEYLKAGDFKKLKCYLGYFSKERQFQECKTNTIEKILKITSIKSLPEEDALREILVNALATQIDYGIVRKEEVKRLRLERKKNKYKHNKKTLERKL